MSDANFSSAINLQLPVYPGVQDLNTRNDLLAIFAAIRILQDELSKATRFVCQFSVDVTAGQYVSVARVTGTTQAVLADATLPVTRAVGFVTSDVATGGWGVVQLQGSNLYLSGLTVGSEYYLSDATPGVPTTVKPVGAGKIVQSLGFALTATELVSDISHNWLQL